MINRKHKKIIAGLFVQEPCSHQQAVVASAVILPAGASFTSKNYNEISLAEKIRLELLIKRHAIDWSLACASHREIKTMGLDRAIRLAIARSISKLETKPDIVLTNVWNIGNTTFWPYGFSLKAASLLANLYQDRYALELAMVG